MGLITNLELLIDMFFSNNRADQKRGGCYLRYSGPPRTSYDNPQHVVPRCSWCRCMQGRRCSQLLTIVIQVNVDKSYQIGIHIRNNCRHYIGQVHLRTGPQFFPVTQTLWKWAISPEIPSPIVFDPMSEQSSLVLSETCQTMIVVRGRGG